MSSGPDPTSAIGLPKQMDYRQESRRVLTGRFWLESLINGRSAALPNLSARPNRMDPPLCGAFAVPLAMFGTFEGHWQCW
jgi:hypothetical protein